MQNNRKLLFFDIDKTLLTPFPWAVPDSARIALKKARDNGHLLFINSGRTYAMIPEIIREYFWLEWRMEFSRLICPLYQTTDPIWKKNAASVMWELQEPWKI